MSKRKNKCGIINNCINFYYNYYRYCNNWQNWEIKDKKIIEETSSDGRYKVIISIIGSTGLTGYSDLVLGVGLKQDENYIIKEYLRCHVHCWTNEEYFKFEWLNDGVKVFFLGCEKGELKYRIYWEDLF